jgi:hypothetical protein
MSEQATLTRGWSIEGFRRFWGKSDPALIPRIREVNTDDIVGYWPKPIGKVRGGTSYIAVIEAIFRVCPDLSLTAEDYARSGDLHFVRWAGAGSGPDGRFELSGIDRIRTLADGRVCENYVCSDSDFFARVAVCLRSDG